MTWADIILLVTKMFDIKQKVIAEKLCVREGHISKIKKGASPSFSVEEFYTKIFKPGAIKIVIETPKHLLDLLKYTIEHPIPKNKHEEETLKRSFLTIKNEMDDCWDITDYKSFVMLMLDRATSVKKKKSKDLPQQKSVSARIDPPNSGQLSENKAEIYIEDKFKCCLFCSYWYGKKERDIKKCDVDEKPHRGTDECEFYTANKDRITTAMLAHH